ncbi:hypothetical protein M3Y96_00748800 [Aphelenchoides besseyi]|nr:hypothetical protein M3Y96_00748800 [Aphelenchoides besseyi]
MVKTIITEQINRNNFAGLFGSTNNNTNVPVQSFLGGLQAQLTMPFGGLATNPLLSALNNPSIKIPQMRGHPMPTSTVAGFYQVGFVVLFAFSWSYCKCLFLNGS